MLAMLVSLNLTGGYKVFTLPLTELYIFKICVPYTVSKQENLKIKLTVDN